MATKKVIFFTAGQVPTAPELAAIAKLNAVTIPQYQLTVMNAQADATYGQPVRLPPVDFVAGTVPTKYNAVTVIDPDAIPNQAA